MLEHRQALMTIIAFNPDTLVLCDLPLEASIEGFKAEPAHHFKACYSAGSGAPVYHFEGPGLSYLSWHTGAYVVRQYLESEGLEAYLDLECLDGSGLRLVRRALLEPGQEAWVYWDNASRLDYWCDTQGLWHTEAAEAIESKTYSDLPAVDDWLTHHAYAWVKQDARIQQNGAHWYCDGYAQPFKSLAEVAQHVERLEASEEAPQVATWKKVLLGGLSLSATALFQRGSQALFGATEVYPGSTPVVPKPSHQAQEGPGFGWGLQVLGKLATLSPLVHRSSGARGLGTLLNPWLWLGLEGASVRAEPQTQSLEATLTEDMQVLLGEEAWTEPSAATHYPHWQSILQEAQGMEGVVQGLETTSEAPRQAIARRSKQSALSAVAMVAEDGTSDVRRSLAHTSTQSVLKVAAPLLALDLEVKEDEPQIQQLRGVLIHRVAELLDKEKNKNQMAIDNLIHLEASQFTEMADDNRGILGSMAHSNQEANQIHRAGENKRRILLEERRLIEQAQQETQKQPLTSAFLCALVNQSDELERGMYVLSLFMNLNFEQKIADSLSTLVLTAVDSVRKELGLVEPEASIIASDSVAQPTSYTSPSPGITAGEEESSRKRLKLDLPVAQEAALIHTSQYEQIRYAAAIMPQSPCRKEALKAFQERLDQVTPSQKKESISNNFKCNAAAIRITAQRSGGEPIIEPIEQIEVAISTGGLRHSEPLALSKLINGLRVNPETSSFHHLDEIKEERVSNLVSFFDAYKESLQTLDTVSVYSERRACSNCGLMLFGIFGIDKASSGSYRFYFSVPEGGTSIHPLFKQFQEAVLLHAYMQSFENGILLDLELKPWPPGVVDEHAKEYNILDVCLDKESRIGPLLQYINDFFKHIQAIDHRKVSLAGDDKTEGPAKELEACNELYSTYTDNSFFFLYQKIREYDKVEPKDTPAFPEQTGAVKCRFS